MRDGFIFYGSFMKALATLDDEERLKAYDAICRYALYDEQPECDGAALGMFFMAQPQIDANRTKRENGMKGGRPKTKKEPNENQNETTSEPKEKVKDKVKDKEKEIRHRHGAYDNVLLTDQEYDRLVKDYGADKTEHAVEFLDEYIEEKGYKSKSHYLAIRRWVFDAIAKQKPPGTKFQNFPARNDQEHRDLVAKVIAMQ